ncbi:MAG: lytic transglycosylase domain-containing protein [Acidobacteriia bacterium]|nr:lytic transglycosylase domain-containing protein [Terriglobia bacterium]
MNIKFHTSRFKRRKPMGVNLLCPACAVRPRPFWPPKLPSLIAVLSFALIATLAIPKVCVAPLRRATALVAGSPQAARAVNLEVEIHRIFERFHMQVDAAWIHEMAVVGTADGVDPRLIAAVVVAESSGDPLAISNQNSIGLMQINAKVWARKLNFTRNNPFDPATNLRMGVTILRTCLDENRGLDSALAAYVGDPEYTKEDTVAYVDRVIRIFEKAANVGVAHSPATRVTTRKEAPQTLVGAFSRPGGL